MSEEYEDREPDTETTLGIAAAVEYGEKYEAYQVTARKVLAAKSLIELAGGYKEAVVMADAVWFADKDTVDVATARASVAVIDDGPECESEPDCTAWLARTHRLMAAEKLLRLASGYAEAFVLLDAVEVASRGEDGIQQVLRVRDAAAGYHERVAASRRHYGE